MCPVRSVTYVSGRSQSFAFAHNAVSLAKSNFENPTVCLKLM